MARRSLQNDNKITNQKKRSFFDISEAEDSISEDSGQEKAVSVKKNAETTKKDKAFRRKSYIAVAVVAVLLCAAIIVSGIDFIVDGELVGLFNDETKPTQYKLYKPDWETDINTLQAYLDLSPDFILYSADGVATTSCKPEDAAPGTELAILMEYFSAIRQGDHEKLNGILSEEYLAKNGEFKDFPMQKIYNIEIVKQVSDTKPDKKYENCYSYAFYAVKYNIYRNDGLFCDEVDETHAREEGLLVVIDYNGVGKIVERIDAKYII